MYEPTNYYKKPAKMKEEERIMDWHESLRHLLSSSAAGEADDGDGDDTERKLPPQIAEMLFVDRAKRHRSPHDSQSTEADTQISRSSSINEDDLNILFEQIDIYDKDDDADADMHHSFPATTRNTRIRHRRRSRKAAENKEESGKAPDADKLSDLLASWGSNSDSMLDYTSLDDMLREENSQTSSALLNVFQPARRQSVETMFSSLEGLDDVIFNLEEEEGEESSHHAEKGG